MKHHRAKAPFQAVIDARWWHDNTMLGYGKIAALLTDIYKVYIAKSTVRDWINELRVSA